MPPVPLWWLSLQHDWEYGLAAMEKVWVSAHHQNSNTCHSYLTTNGETAEMFNSKQISSKVLEVTHVESNTTTRFTAPSAQHKITAAKTPLDVDITTSGELGAVTSGKEVLVFENRSGAVRRTLTGHVAGVTCAKFFPSDLVLLTGGEDTALKIWSVQDGSCPVTMVGHKRALSGLAMIERGKHVLSCSLDGTIKIWSCGKQVCLDTLYLENGSVNDCKLMPDQSGNEDALVVSATEKGALMVHGLQDNSLVAKFDHSSELTACCPVSAYHVVAGSCTGEIITLDLRNISRPLTIYKRSNFSVSAITKDKMTNRVWCAQTDGECYSLLPSEPTLESDPSVDSDPTLGSDPMTHPLHCDVTLSAGDCESICSLVAKNGLVVTSAKDRTIRIYDV